MTKHRRCLTVHVASRYAARAASHHNRTVSFRLNVGFEHLLADPAVLISWMSECAPVWLVLQVIEYEQSGAMKPLKGTRAYLAPEAFTVRAPEEFRKLDYRAMDIWALGIVLHVLLLEQFPWDEAQDSPDFPTYQVCWTLILP
jgi:hypothetical protein